MTPDENAALAECAHAAGQTCLASLPRILTIESTSICNLRCVMCPHAINAVDRPKHIAADVVDSLKNAMAVAQQAQLHGIGEPLASPSFWRALDSGAFHPDSELSVNTNLTLLNDRRLAQLLAVEARLVLNISLDAATEATYRRIRGADFTEVLDNIARLRAARGERTNPTLYMNMTLMHANIEEAPAFVELAHRLGVDGVWLWQLNRWPDRTMAQYRIDRDGWHFDYAEQGLWNYPMLSDSCLRAAKQRAVELGMPLYLDNLKAVFFDAPAEQPPAEAAPAPPPAAETVRDCRSPWEWAMVTSNGDVRPCCHAHEPVGNLGEDSFEAVWNGPTMQALRRDLQAGRVHRACHKAPCKYVQNTLAADARERSRAHLRNGSDLAAAAWRKLAAKVRPG